MNQAGRAGNPKSEPIQVVGKTVLIPGFQLHRHGACFENRSESISSCSDPFQEEIGQKIPPLHRDRFREFITMSEVLLEQVVL
jgi:hypothetical protein